jgi:hypothetical protein
MNRFFPSTGLWRLEIFLEDLPGKDPPTGKKELSELWDVEVSSVPVGFGV